MSLVVYTIPPPINFSKNPMRIVLGTDLPLSTVGLSIEAIISFGKIGEPAEEVLSYPLTPDGLGIVEIDLSRIADSLLSCELPPIAGGTSKATGQSGQFSIDFVEKTLALPDGGTPETVTDIIVIKGGIAYEVWTGQAWFANVYPTPRKIMSWQSNRFVATWEKTWLTYLHLTDTAADYYLLPMVHFTDGTSEAGSHITFPDTTAVQYLFYHFAAGYDQLAIGSVNVAKTVHFYTLTVYDDTDTEVSETVRFNMDYSPVYDRLQFVYFNSLSGLDSVKLLGEHQQAPVRTFELVDRNTSRGNYRNEELPAQSGMNSVFEQMVYKGNIGLADDAQTQDLRRELFLSLNIFIPKTTRWWPVNVVDRTVGLGKLNAQLRELDIDWNYAWQNTQYTPEFEDLGEEPAETIECPVITTGSTSNSIDYSFSHAPGSVNRYRVKLFDEAGTTQIGSDVVHTIPFGNPIAGSFTGLDPETTYNVVMYIEIIGTTFTQTCTTAAVDTTAVVVIGPGNEGGFTFEVNPVDTELNPKITNAIFGSLQITLATGAYAIRKADGIVDGVAETGTLTLYIYYSSLMDNTITVRDSVGTFQNMNRSGNGVVAFTGVVSNNTNDVTITIS